jgi:hypothetical protein
MSTTTTRFLTQRIGTGQDCAMSGCWAIRYFSLPGEWQISGFIGWTGEAYRVRWDRLNVTVSTAAEAVAVIEGMSGHLIPAAA